MFSNELVINVEDLTARVTFLIGKNGSGKSTQLRKLSDSLGVTGEWYCAYVVPERGGLLLPDAGIENQVRSDPNYVWNSRRDNRMDNFKQQSVSQFLKLERLVLQDIEGNKQIRASDYTFNDEVEKLNRLLPHIKLERTDGGFNVRSKYDNSDANVRSLSSGESELISLGIEVLMFSRAAKSKSKRLLLLDEPDVHLHPDLQSKFVEFLIQEAKEGEFQVIVATHSTAFIGGSSKEKDNVRLAILRDFKVQNGAGDIYKLIAHYYPIEEFLTTVLPIFGANPLSNVFMEKPILLIEGDDDLRVWEQVIRSSNGKFKYQPCPVGGKQLFESRENDLENILTSLYDEARGYSLRDGDGVSEPLQDKTRVSRFRMNALEIENLLLSDEVFEQHGVTWEVFKNKCETYVSQNPNSQTSRALTQFKHEGYDRLKAKVEGFRMAFPELLNSTQSWEVLIGKCFAKSMNDRTFHDTSTSFKGMLSEKFWATLIEPLLI